MTEAAPSLDEVIASAPETLAPSSDPITPEAVQSDKAPEESLPDSSLIARRLQAVRDRTAEVQRKKQTEQEYQKLQREVELLRTLRGTKFDAQYDKTVEEVEERKDDQSALMREVRAELKALNEERTRFKQEREQAEYEQELRDTKQQFVEWVKEQRAHFPLLNRLGQQELPFQKMLNQYNLTGQYISEAQATSEVESEIRSIVETLAPLLGYTKSDVEPRREEKVSVGAGNMSMSDPLDFSSMDDDEALNALIRQYDKSQR
jgi:hypothetical protein